jgi:hypothetical protein
MRTSTLLVFAVLLLGGCQPPDTRSEQMRQWLSESRMGCDATAAVLKALRRGVAAFETIYAAELDRTKRDRRPFQRYNPQFLARLEAALPPLDTTRGPLANRLARDVWPSQVRFVKGAPEVLPRLHRFLVLLAQLRATVAIARRLERRFSRSLQHGIHRHKKPGPASGTTYGVLIQSHRRARFRTHVPAPARRPDHTAACAPYKNTLRRLSPTDPELMNRVECRGRDKIVYTAHLYHLVQIQLILAKIKKLDPRGLAIAFRRSAE